ncbi:MAG: protein serine/threonine phosphatase [Ignavibacteria bacterium]|nr:MAG: protein serine/threonine phosphatase [Ignavibacteria bacterium]KAF0161015.1 MAG: protein serine/threonine phosphatase [Ignavibacteria bacterium]
MAIQNENPIKRIYELYTSGMSYQEIERLIKKEAGEVYEFFANDIPKPDQHKNKFIRSLIFIRSLFNAFVLKLTPGRRIFYIASLLFFAVGYSSPSYVYLLLAFVIVNLLLAFELADKLSAKGELDVARKIQSDLIPKHGTTVFNYDIATYYEPAREVGGDYFDVIEQNEKFYITVGDISGKGMAAALYMVRVQSILHQLLNNVLEVKEIIIDLKKYFSKNLRKEFFLTMSLASIEKDGSIKIVRAGHLPAIWLKADKKEFEILNTAGLGIGLNDRGIFEKTIETAEIKPEKNDIVFLCSDGVTEAMNLIKDQFGEENVKRIIANNSDKSAEDIKNALLRAITSFRGTALQNDDITFIVLKAH